MGTVEVELSDGVADEDEAHPSADQRRQERAPVLAPDTLSHGLRKTWLWRSPSRAG